MHKMGKTGDMFGEFYSEDETSRGQVDFHSTFMEVSHHRDDGSSEIDDQLNGRRPQDDDMGDRSLEPGDEMEAGAGTDSKRTDEENGISAPVGLASTQMDGENVSATPAIVDSGTKERAFSDYAKAGDVKEWETLKAGRPAILEPERRIASAENGNPKTALIFSETSPAKKSSGSTRQTEGEAGSAGKRPVRHFHGQVSAMSVKNGHTDLKMETAGTKDKGISIAVSGSGSSGKIDGQVNTETAKSRRTDLKTETTGTKDKGIPVSGSGSSERVGGRINAEAGKGGLSDLKMETAGAKDKGTPVSGSGSQVKIDGHSNTETGTGKGEIGYSKANDSHGAGSPVQGSERGWLKTHFNEALAHRGGFISPGAFSAQGREGSGRHSAESSKKSAASVESASKPRQTGSRYPTGAGELRETRKDRNGNRASRFDLPRDGREKRDTSKLGSGEQRVEMTGEKNREETGAAKFASRVSSLTGEQGFDRSVSKSETSTSDNPTLSAGNTSSSAKIPGNIPRFAETEMVRQSFKESGVRQFVEKASLNLRNGQQEFRIALKPESLGEVKVQVSTENHQVTIRILTELPLAKEMIENNVHQLKAELHGHGLEIDKFEVSLSQGSDKSGVEQGFSGSKKMKKAFRQGGRAKEISSAPDAERDDWTRLPLSGNGAINLFA
ncbi:MAG: flagellar hook-length control protein FliK [Deltaproteobacteria bacterium]|nr:flagellar hook-length control protein FliK [Deltaproteobacteria bacterium]